MINSTPPSIKDSIKQEVLKEIQSIFLNYEERIATLESEIIVLQDNIELLESELELLKAQLREAISAI